MFETILLAVDGSEHGQHAAKTAGDLARAVKARDLRIVVAYEPIPAYLGEPNLSQAIAGTQNRSKRDPAESAGSDRQCSRRDQHRNDRRLDRRSDH